MVKICADICHESYGPGVGYKDVGDLRYGLIRESGRDILVFRGTANWQNAVRDGRFLPTRSYKGHLVHRGFQSALERVYRSVCQTVPISMRQDLVITGHSLGGAMAVLLAELFGSRVITFGCPRVYWRWGPAPMMRHDRIICDDDPVPMVPRALYRHLCEPKGVLADRDGGIDFGDHGIAVYQARLAVQGV